MKIQTGEKLDNFVFDTPFEPGLELKETAERVSGRTALLFLRYYGCTLCQLDIHRLAAGYDQIRDAGGQVLVVLQSRPQTIAGQLKPGDLPFDIICDPEGKLYKAYGIAPAESMEAMVDSHTMEKIKEAQAEGYQHGEYEGNELQLPAAAVIEKDLTVVFVHYGTSAGDVPDVKELADLLTR
ncbi:MAG TPA: redoxin domain-containing protein [Candidatus Lachnoclostridium pullistercoris]|uniref:Redoxin domain-containing protein n=1 Tax=Candidatus Lachnoclostridium pullistercoris TaxID=2838632 RepID=A0A9D2PG40_9FIRM|nr:redoxin domain-containing protein [Candidatus Lachnoclostridium pullistercoris]